MDFLVTSLLIIICLFYVYNANIIWPLLFLLIFVPLEVCMVVANLRKVPHGAWFPLLMAGIFFSFLCLWRWARSKKVDQEYEQRIKIGDLFPIIHCKNNNNKSCHILKKMLSPNLVPFHYLDIPD